MILVEHPPGLDRVEAIVGGDGPRDLEHPLDVGADHLVLGRGLRHPLQAIHFAHRPPPRRPRAAWPRSTRRAGPSSSSPSLSPELLLNRLQLLAQVVLPLRVGHFLLRLRLDLALQLEQRDLARAAPTTIAQLDGRLFSSSSSCLSSAFMSSRLRQQVGEPQRVVDVDEQRAAARARVPLASDTALSTSSCSRRTYASISMSTSRPARDAGSISARIRLPSRVTSVDPDAGEALDENLQACRPLRHLADHAHRADRRAGRRASDRPCSLVLHDEQHHAIAGEGAVDAVDRHRPIHGQRLRPSSGTTTVLPQRQDRELLGKRGCRIDRVGHGVRRQSTTPGALVVDECRTRAGVARPRSEEQQRLVRRNLDAAPAASAGDLIVDADQIIA